MKDYDYNGLAGCVVQRVSKKTGHLVGLYNNAQAGFDDDGGAMPWSTLCEPHSHVIAHRTLALARDHLGDPTGWCEDCMAEERERGAA